MHTRLTEREKAVLSACANGKNNRQIGKQLGIVERTVEFHLASVFKKLKAKNRTHAVALAIRNWLIDYPLAWQPIETAPKDGAEVLLAFGYGYDAPPPITCYWNSEREDWLLGNSLSVPVSVPAKPTHWMPLPEPPK